MVRFAAVVEDPAVLRQAVDLCEYGRRLSPHLQYSGEQPFEELFPSSALFFRAQLGEQIDEALEFFKTAGVREREEGNLGPAEVYVGLLVRLKRYEEAFDAHAELIPEKVQLSGFAPSLMEIAALGKLHDRLTSLCRDRGDLIGFVAGWIDKQQVKA